ncbi:hypothetical protein NA57DRAFT_61389 [Rhizodiscina lignyota]|uniref:Uncharacterized protein n=1 Tax=Rhizodiscina lignyota TaxID=1504668 RepID=A0A9P4M5B8_9PEZI|nr:hypothetical protein NA57DRAFT_61389 [Rhizodiscina lignyota]
MSKQNHPAWYQEWRSHLPFRRELEGYRKNQAYFGQNSKGDAQGPTTIKAFADAMRSWLRQEVKMFPINILSHPVYDEGMAPILLEALDASFITTFYMPAASLLGRASIEGWCSSELLKKLEAAAWPEGVKVLDLSQNNPKAVCMYWDGHIKIVRESKGIDLYYDALVDDLLKHCVYVFIFGPTDEEHNQQFWQTFRRVLGETRAVQPAGNHLHA